MAMLAQGTSRCYAGATASQWIIVVNGDSDRSRTIANHYTTARNIPFNNVIVLRGIPARTAVTITEFRDRILAPVLAEIDRRKLSSHVQGIAYSSDFPSAVNLSGELSANPDRSKYLTPVASLNGMTYLFRFVNDKNDTYLAFNNNWYAQRPPATLFTIAAGGEIAESQLESLNRARESKNYAEQGKLLDEILAKLPHQHPVAYAAAQAWAMAGEKEKGLDRLGQAIENGWCYRDFTRDDAQLLTLRQSPRYQTLLRACEEMPFDWTPTVGFDARRFYAPNGISSPQSRLGVSYLLSMMLAECSVNGNTEDEALAALARSVTADYQQPKGTFFFTDTSDVRTQCRRPGFPVAVDRLKRLGHAAEITTAQLPIQSPAVAGVTMGMASFSWGTAQSTFVPGAIGDNLTSLGAAMDHAGQTKLTEYLRHGAAGASGTVMEPYSIQAKFPHPTIHAAYAEGLTLAEAFYTSVAGPYQLLIVGDPLCQPYAQPPRFEVRGMVAGKMLEDGTAITFDFDKPERDDTAPRAVDFLLDGVLRGQVAPRSRMQLTNKSGMPGWHELRFLAVDDSRVEHRYEAIVPFISGDVSQQLRLSTAQITHERTAGPLVLELETTQTPTAIEILHDHEVVYRAEAFEPRIELPTEQLGRGPVRLRAILHQGDQQISSPPITITLE